MSHTMTDMTPTLPPLGPLPEPSFKEAPAFLPNSASTAPYEGPVYPAMFTAEQVQSYATEYGEQCARQAVQDYITTAFKVADGMILVERQLLQDAESSLGSFCSDEGCGAADMQAMDNLSAALSASPAAPGPQAVQACGHPESMLLKSAETGEPLYCEACDDKSGRRDAELRESELLAANKELREQLAQALATQPPTQQAQQASAQPTQAAKGDFHGDA